MHDRRYRLVADIGGTNARFALLDPDAGTPRHERTVRCADYDGLESAIRAYLDTEGVARIHDAAIDVATGITGDRIALTNGPWEFSIRETRDRLGLDRLLVINDFTALALAVPHLQPHEKVQVGRGAPVPGTAIAVIGPGTGLGVSGLLPVGDSWIALQGEGGHTAFSPTSAREIEVLRWLLKRFDHVSTERVVSGMGLQNLYQALCGIDGVAARSLAPDQITAAALDGSEGHCREALELFCVALGAAAANLVVTLGARGGCYIGGGIVPKLGEYFAGSAFRGRFERKGRFTDYVAAVPTYVIDAGNPALRGLAALLGRQAA